MSAPTETNRFLVGVKFPSVQKSPSYYFRRDDDGDIVVTDNVFNASALDQEEVDSVINRFSFSYSSRSVYNVFYDDWCIYARSGDGNMIVFVEQIFIQPVKEIPFTILNERN